MVKVSKSLVLRIFKLEEGGWCGLVLTNDSPEMRILAGQNPQEQSLPIQIFEESRLLFFNFEDLVTKGASFLIHAMGFVH